MQDLKNASQHKTEWFAMLKIIGNLSSFIEIGTCEGGTFESLSEITTGKKISIDMAGGKWGGISKQQAQIRNTRITQKFKDCYFIDADSKTIESVKKVNDILGDQKVDFLFIDGDHSFLGVQSDFMLYRQFVKQGGYIAFHDIIDSEFHRENNCFVNLFWNKIKHIGTEFISPDNTDVTDNFQHIQNHQRFGGIGLIKNDFSEHQYKIFQVIHDQKSIDLCISNVGNYIPTLIYNSDNVFFENNIISKVRYAYQFDENSRIGITSPIVHLKTLLTIDQLIEYSKNSEVFNYGDLKTIAANNFDVWALNGNGKIGSNLYMASKKLNESNVLPFDIFKNKWITNYCNYFFVTQKILNDYVDSVLTPVMNWIKGKPEYMSWNTPKTGLFHRNKWYPISVFICECMFGSFLANKKYKIKSIRGKLNTPVKVLINR